MNRCDLPKARVRMARHVRHAYPSNSQTLVFWPSLVARGALPNTRVNKRTRSGAFVLWTARRDLLPTSPTLISFMTRALLPLCRMQAPYLPVNLVLHSTMMTDFHEFERAMLIA